MSEYREASSEAFERISAQAAGYMELPGAKKDADCHKVYVRGGVAKYLGCCNLYKWNKGRTKAFRCGVCKFLAD